MITVCLGGSAKELNLKDLPEEVLRDFRGSFDDKTFEFSSNRSADFLLAINHNSRLYRKFIKSGGSKSRAILIRFEPDSVFPAQYKKRITSKYGLVISPGSTNHIGNTDTQIRWPYQYHLNPTKPSVLDPQLTDILKSDVRDELFTFESWQKRTHTLTMIASNKVSPIGSANYSIRRKMAKELPVEVLEVYGQLWSDSLYEKIYHRLAVTVTAIRQGTIPNLTQIYGNLFRTYHTTNGIVADKHKLLQDSKFSLVIENSNSIVTEKIFDAIINGSIPIYIGPDINLVGLPKNLVCKVEGTANEILEALKLFDKETTQRYLLNMSKFIQGQDFLNDWGSAAVYTRMASRVSDYCIKVKSL
jgi:hypothetical protein